MKVLILAAGYGTRLYPLIKDTPKALLPVNGRPLVDYILDKFADLPELSEVLLVTNDKFEKHFENWAQAHRDFPVPIRIINDGTNSPEGRLGSMGDINYVITREKVSEDLIVAGSDNLFDAEVGEFVKFAKKNSPSTTIGLYDIGAKENAKIYGVVSLDEQRKVSSFEEKPQNPKSSLIGMCLYFYPRSSLGQVAKFLAETKRADKAGDYIQWLYQKEPVYGFKFQGKWYDIGSVESYQDASQHFSG